MSGLWRKDGGIYLGYACENTRGEPQNLGHEPIGYRDDRHILTFGPNGSGKTRRALMVNLLRLSQWSVVVVDPKGELARRTGGLRELYGPVYYLNPYEIDGFVSTKFNPLLSLNPKAEHFVDDAMRLSEAIIAVEGNEPHWSASAQELVTAFIMDAALAKNPADRTLRHIRDGLGKPMTKFAEQIGKMRETGVIEDWDELAIKAARFLDVDPQNRELNSVISTALTQTRWIDSRAIKKHTDEGRIDFRELKQKPVTVYLMLPANRLATQSKWLRLVLTCVIQTLMEDAKPGSTPVLLALEEAAALGHLPIIEDTMAMMRGYGIKLWSIFQDVHQVEDIYGKRWGSFVANAGVVQSFASRDTTTAQFLSDMAGQKTEEIVGFQRQSSVETGRAEAETLSFGKVPVPEMLPQEFMRMDMGFTAIFSHKTKGLAFSYLPDPSEMAGIRDKLGP